MICPALRWMDYPPSDIPAGLTAPIPRTAPFSYSGATGIVEPRNIQHLRDQEQMNTLANMGEFARNYVCIAKYEFIQELIKRDTRRTRMLMQHSYNKGTK